METMEEIQRRSLSQLVAGKLAVQIINGTYQAGYQLPAERDLIKQFGVSRSTLREALRMLEEIKLIESKHGVGWFVSQLDDSNLKLAHKLAEEVDSPSLIANVSLGGSPLGPRRLPAAPEKPVIIPNLQTDRLGTFPFISWWEREKVENAHVLVVGAGALGRSCRRTWF